MTRSTVGLTDLALAARSNDPSVVSVFGENFPKARLHLPLLALEGVRNRPESAIELGARLPVHWLELDNGEKAVPVFTSLTHCRGSADKLGWTTEGGPIKALAVPGDVALGYLTQVLVTPGVERCVLNPLSDAELHLARTEVEALAGGRPLRSLWFYSRNGKLRRPVRFEGASLLGSLLSKAEGVLESWTEAPPPPPIPLPEATEAVGALEHVESRGPLGALVSELYRIASEERVENLEVAVTKSNGRVKLDATPSPPPELLERLRAAAERALASETGDARLSFRIDANSVVLSSSSSSETKAPPPPPVPRAPAKRFGYIPLEPEDATDES